jgi:hypothetical protein
LYSEHFTKEASGGFRGFRIGGQVIRTVKCADDLLILAKEEDIMNDTIDIQIENGRYYGM